MTDAPLPTAGPAGRRADLAPAIHLTWVALFLAIVIGNEVLLFSLRGRIWALQLVHRDTSGEVFAASPGPDRRVRAGRLELDYTVGMDMARMASLGVPATTGGDDGLDDLRADVRWVRSRLRSGEGYVSSRWRLEEVVAAAADSSQRFFCLSYACAMVSVAELQGYAARVVFLGRHITSEVYLPARGQWVMADATYDVIPHGSDGAPLSVLDAHWRLAAGRPVEWRTVVGETDDDASLDGPTRNIVESLLIAGDFQLRDGALTFGQLTNRERAWDVLRGRPRVIQLALRGQPALDGYERRLRTALAAWNATGLAVLLAFGLVMRRGARAR